VSTVIKRLELGFEIGIAADTGVCTDGADRVEITPVVAEETPAAVEATAAAVEGTTAAVALTMTGPDLDACGLTNATGGEVTASKDANDDAPDLLSEEPRPTEPTAQTGAKE